MSQLTERQRQEWNAYMREYRKRNPDKTLLNRIRTAIHLLEKHGYTVKKVGEAE